MNKFLMWCFAFSLSMGFALTSCGGGEEDEPNYEPPYTSSFTAPTGVSGMVVSNGVQLSWNPVDDAEFYTVSRSSSKNGTTVSLGYIGDVGLVYNTSVIDTNPLDGDNYYFIRACKDLRGNTYTVSPESTPIYVQYNSNNTGGGGNNNPGGGNDNPGGGGTQDKPSAPVISSKGWDSLGGNDYYTYLNWNKAYGKNYTYKVYKATSASGSFTVIKTTQENSISDSQVQLGKSYFYKVKAFDSAGNSSDYSETVEITLSNGGTGSGGGGTVKAPNRPVIQSVTMTTAGKMTVKWKMNSHPTCDNPDGFDILIHDYTYDTNFVITSVSKNATSATFSPGIHANSDGWIMGGVKAFNDGGSETATFRYNVKTNESFY